MTNEELIAKIKGEIERLKEVTKPHKGQGIILTQELRRSYDYLLSFLSTLEEQLKEVRNPIFDECVANVDPEVMEEVSRIIELEEEYKDYVESDPVYSKLVNRNAGLSIARHFYELGCRRTAEKYDEIEYNRQRAEESVPNDLEEAAEKHSTEYDSVIWDVLESSNQKTIWKREHKETFIAGAKWQKEQDEKEQADLFTIVALDAAERAKKKMIEDFPKWRKIKAGERLPCPAYVWTTAYDNYPDCFEGRLMPNIQGVKVGRDTWYLPVDVIHNLPKED